MVRRQHGHDGVARATADMDCGEADAGGGIAADGFHQDIFRGNFRELPSQFIGMSGARDDQGSIRRYQGGDPAHRFLNDGPVSRNVQKVLRLVLAAPRPESGPLAAGHDHGIHEGFAP
jgi:hypothetical protein